MSTGCQNDEGLVPERLRVRCFGLHRSPGNVYSALTQPSQELFGSALPDLPSRSGRLRQIRRHGRNSIGRDGPQNAEAHSLAARLGDAERPEGGFALVEDVESLAMKSQGLGGRYHPPPAARAIEQGFAEFALQCLETSRYGGLRDAEVLRRLRNAAEFDDGSEEAEVLNFHRNSLCGSI